MLPPHLPAGEVCSAWLARQDRPFHIALLYRADSFRRTEGQPLTLRRALALNEVLDRCELPLLPGELLLGSDLGRLAESGDEAALAAAREVVEALGSRSFHTHFDHHAPDYPLLLEIGLGGLRERAAEWRDRHADPARRIFLESVVVALEGLSRHLLRWAEAAEEAAADSDWAPLLRAQADMLRHLAVAPPRSFAEALQLTLLVHFVWRLDERYAMALGRLDQFAWPFYRADLEAGRLTEDEAQTLLDHFLARLAHPGNIQNIALGGLTPEGEDATNDLSYMILEAVKRIGQPGGNVTARVHQDTPRDFLLKCAEVIRTGIGFPALYNDDIEVPALVAQGYPLEEARDYCFVGCIECFIPGRQAPWADSRFNLLHCVSLALHGGRDSLTGEQAGPATGEPADWQEFYAAFHAQIVEGVRAHVEEFNRIRQEAEDRADDLTSPLLSALVSDCLERGLDLCAGGARWPGNHGLAGVGIGSTADALMAVKRFVYDRRELTLDQLREVLAADFAEQEGLRQRLLWEAPKYGNDQPEVDALAVQVTRDFAAECARYRTPRGGFYWPLMAANVSNVWAGEQVGATPDGRRCGEPTSDAASPGFGRDVNGPTAAARSIARLPYHLCPGGNVVNMKFHPSALRGEAGLAALAGLIRACFDLGGAQLQFNATDPDTLRDAMQHPERYPHLVVRVSGFSAYFVNLAEVVQQDLLARTVHGV